MRVGATPILEKRSENAGANENLSCGFPSIPRIAPGSSCSENCGFRVAQVVRCHSENQISHCENQFLNSESCSENALKLFESSENDHGLFTLDGRKRALLKRTRACRNARFKKR